MEMPFKKSKHRVIVNVKVQPRSSGRGIERLQGDTLRIKLTSPPVDNAANEELIEILSEAFGVRKSAISIIKGLTSRQKVVEIRGIDSL